MNTKFGGYTSNPVEFSPSVRAQALTMIITARFGIILDGKEVEKGTRFNDNKSMLWRLESGVTEAEFIADPVRLVYQALQAAAEADWWYSHEKDYGGNDRECGCSSDCTEEN